MNLVQKELKILLLTVSVFSAGTLWVLNSQLKTEIHPFSATPSPGISKYYRRPLVKDLKGWALDEEPHFSLLSRQSPFNFSGAAAAALWPVKQHFFLRIHLRVYLSLC